MNVPVLFEQITDGSLPAGHFYAHMPSLGLPPHGFGVDGARMAALDLASLWIGEKQANGERVAPTGETLFSTLEVPEDDLQCA
ncbi:MAG: hypothetical protein WCP53_12765 [Verrucomicrobiota bacterium]